MVGRAEPQPVHPDRRHVAQHQVAADAVQRDLPLDLVDRAARPAGRRTTTVSTPPSLTCLPRSPAGRGSARRCRSAARRRSPRRPGRRRRASRPPTPGWSPSCPAPRRGRGHPSSPTTTSRSSGSSASTAAASTADPAPAPISRPVFGPLCRASSATRVRGGPVAEVDRAAQRGREVDGELAHRGDQLLAGRRWPAVFRPVGQHTAAHGADALGSSAVQRRADRPDRGSLDRSARSGAADPLDGRRRRAARSEPMRPRTPNRIRPPARIRPAVGM